MLTSITYLETMVTKQYFTRQFNQTFPVLSINNLIYSYSMLNGIHVKTAAVNIDVDIVSK